MGSEAIMSTAAVPRNITADEFYRMGDASKGFELVNGERKELGMSAQSSRVGGQIHFQLESYSRSRNPGWAFPPETGYQCFADDPDRVRKPDASFIVLGRMTRQQYEEEGFIEIVPDLVAEVISPSDSAEEVEEKIEMWLTAGVKLLWEVYPNTQTIRAHRPDGTIALFRAADMLAAPDVLPGFASPVAELFRVPGEPVPAT
jgi:Uma2 family endonuclease